MSVVRALGLDIVTFTLSHRFSSNFQAFPISDHERPSAVRKLAPVLRRWGTAERG
jgi:hypothetical protein